MRRETILARCGDSLAGTLSTEDEEVKPINKIIMNYTLIGKRNRNKSKMVTISTHLICFTKSFMEWQKVQRYVSVYKDDNDFLCFKFSREREPDSYAVQLHRSSCYFRIPTAIREIYYDLKGAYSAKERDGYIVTDCKLKER